MSGNHTIFFFQSYGFKNIYFWLCLVFVAARGLSLVTVSGGTLLPCVGFSLRWLLVLFGTQAPEHGLSSCDIRA